MTTAIAEEVSLREMPMTASRRRFYAPELDLLRLFAFLIVFMRHVATGFGIARQQAAGAIPSRLAAYSSTTDHNPWILIQGLTQSLDFGVCLFFFLSSYLITSLLLIEKNVTGRVDVRDFYVRRTLRIWPLYFAFLAAMVLVGQYQPWLNITRYRVVASFLLVANWPIVLHGWIGSPIEPLWSVSIEEQFYLLWPQLARFGRTAIVATCGLLSVVPFAVIAIVGHMPNCTNPSLWTNSLVQCLFFASGALTATLLGQTVRPIRPATRVLLFVGGWTCWFCASSVCHVVRTESPGVGHLVVGYALVMAGVVLIFLCFFGWRPAHLPSSLLYLGKITYGLYVFHFFFLEVVLRVAVASLARFHAPALPLLGLHAACAIVALGLTIGCAIMSYTFLERPFLMLKKRFTIIPSRPA
jgi:peptidoglycan/LPS O-acetylase OafA/YrhL